MQVIQAVMTIKIFIFTIDKNEFIFKSHRIERNALKHTAFFVSLRLCIEFALIIATI